MFPLHRNSTLQQVGQQQKQSRRPLHRILTSTLCLVTMKPLSILLLLILLGASALAAPIQPTRPLPLEKRAFLPNHWS